MTLLSEINNENFHLHQVLMMSKEEKKKVKKKKKKAIKLK
jgi:hypothetical protein